MAYKLVRLVHSDGTWDTFCTQWKDQCVSVKEDFDTYANDAMQVLKDVSSKEIVLSKQRHAWVVALYKDNEPLVASMVNVAPIPGYKQPVMRIRQLTVCPLLDYGEIAEDEYAEALIQITWQLYQLSNSTLNSRHIHLHLRSPADVAFFSAFGKSLNGSSVFNSVTTHGAWLHIEKKTLTK
jgi:hypothetical protein